MKLISICIPCYNEEKNISPIYRKVKEEIEKLNEYKYEIIFADNHSSDGSIEVLREIAATDSNVKVILNQANFGLMRSQRNCVFHAKGDAIICLACDLQEPAELIPEFIKGWEEGYKIVWGQKTNSKESSMKIELVDIDKAFKYYQIK